MTWFVALLTPKVRLVILLTQSYLIRTSFFWRTEARFYVIYMQGFIVTKNYYTQYTITVKVLVWGNIETDWSVLPYLKQCLVMSRIVDSFSFTLLIWKHCPTGYSDWQNIRLHGVYWMINQMLPVIVSIHIRHSFGNKN